VTTERWRHPAPGRAKIIHIDVDPLVPGTNYKVDVPIVGDARLCLAALHDAVGFAPSTPLREGLWRFSAWFKDYYRYR
jgi:acetolactate synthase I/II/III large subunit